VGCDVEEDESYERDSETRETRDERHERDKRDESRWTGGSEGRCRRGVGGWSPRELEVDEEEGEPAGAEAGGGLVALEDDGVHLRVHDGRRLDGHPEAAEEHPSVRPLLQLESGSFT
jgi:hypothetical protein